MYFIVFGFVIIFFVFSTTLKTEVNKIQRHQNTQSSGIVDATTLRLKEATKITIRDSHNTIRYDSKDEQEVVYSVLQRACNNIYQKGIALKCSNADSVYTVWGFAGTVGGEGSLEDAWSGSTSTTFTCGGEDDYGRGLIQDALPLSYIQDGKWGYDFSDISDPSAYPCGYDEIITKK